MYAGRVLEEGPTSTVLEHPRHPYTQALVAAIPDVRQPRALRGIGGVSVGVGDWPTGCAFAPRCEHVQPQCESVLPALAAATADHNVRCCRWQDVSRGETRASSVRMQPGARTGVPLLDVAGLEARYGSQRDDQPAVHDVSFAIEPGECLALVGESGSGKSTIARCIAGLHVPSAGTITFDGRPVDGAARARTLDVRRRIQIVFQNPYQSLNPRQRVSASIERPLRILRRLSSQAARQEVGELLQRVRLPARLAERFPGELSGGERQRVAIARALAAQPDLLVCDEVTSALDVSVQAAVLGLLQELRADLRLSMLFITHNLGVVACIADSVLVIDKGSVCEAGPVDAVLNAPTHDYTQRLLHAAPSLFEGRAPVTQPEPLKVTTPIRPL
jgi:peptide/nickel transport system ATP-binding protein